MTQSKPRDVLFQDIDLKFTKHPITDNLVTLRNDAAILRSIKNLVLSQKYEYFYNPKKHSRVTSSLFEPYTPFLLEDLERSVRDVINNFEPRVELIDLAVNEDLDNNGYNISLFLRSLNSKEPIEQVIFLKKLR